MEMEIIKPRSRDINKFVHHLCPVGFRVLGLREGSGAVSVSQDMAFWGVEVKPGKPFTHKYDDLKGRLHISMATLGFGTATAKSILQCNVGNRSPLYLCSIYPGNTESLQLNLELEELDEVIFSVIGPRSIHLCGYYLASGRNSNINEDSESYGEDIADTETERSGYSDEDDYEDSFIDDNGDPEAFPSSPVSNEEEASLDNRPKGRKGSLRRLRRKYQSVESDDDGCSEEKITVNDSMHDQTKEIDNEDSLPISSLYKNKASGMDDCGDRGVGDASNKNGEDGGNSIIDTNFKTDNVLVDSQTHREAELSDHLVDPCTVLDVGNIKKFKKRKKGKEKEAKSSCNDQSIKLDNSMQDEPKMGKMTRDLLAGNQQYQDHADDKETETTDKIPPSSEVGHGQGEKPKKKRKERSKEGINLVANGAYHSNLVNLPQRNEHNKQHTINERVDDGALDFPDGNQSEDRKVKKRKKKSKSQGNVEIVNSEMPLSVKQSSETVKEDGNKRADAKPSQVRTLSNGLVIQELEMGTKDGKIAASGRKISVHYIGKLKENEVVFESNAGQAPFKFRLGKGEVIEGWDVGLEGMRVGEKRRLVIPPSMASKSERHSANIPPNSWLVYDFELVKVH